MDRHRVAAVVAVALLALAGCGGTLEGTAEPPTTTQTDSPATTATPGGPTTTDPGGTTPADPGGTTPADPNGTNGSLAYESLVVDLAPGDPPAIEGGLAHSPNGSITPTYYATLLSGTDRLDESVLPESAVEFVANTDFETATVVAVQAYPKSSVPDYRVESVTDESGRLDVRINDSSRYGTDDITLETVLIRVEHGGTPPAVAAVTTQDGVSFDTNDGQVTVERRPDQQDGVDLPVSSPDASANVDDPRDLTVDNDADSVAGYNVTVVGEPSGGGAETVLFQRQGKVRPGESLTVADLIAKRGSYEIIVTAERDGETASDRFEWTVSATYYGAFVTISEEGVSITQTAT